MSALVSHGMASRVKCHRSWETSYVMLLLGDGRIVAGKAA